MIRLRASVPLDPRVARARERAVRPALVIVERRCNRCGHCLALGCPAITDVGGEALEIAPDACTGCGLCAPLCRGRAITPSS